MFALTRRQKERKKAAQALYRTIQAQARHPAFYRSWGVPDTVDGRFELILLHAYLVWNRLRTENEAGRLLGQTLFDVMFRDMDIALRNSGVGDLSVPHHIKRMMKAFKGRAVVYDKALRADDPQAVLEALRRNLFGTVAKPDIGDVARFGTYLRQNQVGLGQVNSGDVLAGMIYFTDIEHDDRRDERTGKPSGSRMVA